jgi:hypothetical protein
MATAKSELNPPENIFTVSRFFHGRAEPIAIGSPPIVLRPY